MKRHEWKERGDSGTCHFRATHHAGNWQLHLMREEDEDWVLEDPISLEHLRVLRDLLMRKYQRRRVPFEHVEQLDKMIETSAQ